jgi:hypothetical protein
LHQAVEAKEGVKIQNETVTLASISYQNFFLQVRLRDRQNPSELISYRFFMHELTNSPFVSCWLI